MYFIKLLANTPGLLSTNPECLSGLLSSGQELGDRSDGDNGITLCYPGAQYPFTVHAVVRLSLAYAVSVTKTEETSRNCTGKTGEALCWCPRAGTGAFRLDQAALGLMATHNGETTRESGSRHRKPQTSSGLPASRHLRTREIKRADHSNHLVSGPLDNVASRCPAIAVGFSTGRPSPIQRVSHGAPFG